MNKISNVDPITIIGGVNVIESEEQTMKVCEAFKETTSRLGLNFIFKASFDKANRSSLASYRGPGLETGTKIFEKVKLEFDVPIITDVHEVHQVDPISEAVDFLQIPAFLARQTDLVMKIAGSQKPVNIKKPQFMSPSQITHVVDKLTSAGNDQAMICERGSVFGYDNLVVDMLGMGSIKRALPAVPLIFDVTHSLQIRDGLASSSGGRRSQFMDLAKSGIAVGIAGVFMEAHEDPDSALCDGPSALPISHLDVILQQIKVLDECVKSLDHIEID